MKTSIFFFLMLLGISVATRAQCDKKVILTGSQTTYMDSSGVVDRTVDEKSVIHISKSDVVIEVDGEQKMNIAIKSNECKWDVPYKQGKSVIKGSGSKEPGQVVNVSIDVEGKDGKVILLFRLEGRPTIIKVITDKFEAEG